MSLRPRNLAFHELQHLPPQFIETVHARGAAETDQLKMP
jgi:hypothetical protein